MKKLAVIATAALILSAGGIAAVAASGGRSCDFTDGEHYEACNYYNDDSACDNSSACTSQNDSGFRREQGGHCGHSGHSEHSGYSGHNEHNGHGR